MLIDHPSSKKVIRIGLLIFALMCVISGTLPLALISPDIFTGNTLPEQLPAFLIVAVVNYSLAIFLLLVRSKYFKKKRNSNNYR
ncbi:hypothetical protein ACQ0QQ_01965 [Lysinibacillus sphaericus]